MLRKISLLLASWQGLSLSSSLSSLCLLAFQGSTFPFSPCGHGFMPDPSSSQPGSEDDAFEHTEITTNIDTLLSSLSQVGLPWQCTLSYQSPAVVFW